MPVGCRRVDCAGCAKRVSYRRGVSLYGRIAGLPIAMLTLTLPSAICDAIGAAHVKPLRKLAHSTVNDWARTSLGVRIGAVAFLHPDGEPGRWWPHFHVVCSTLGLGEGGVPVELSQRDLHGRVGHLGEAWGIHVRGIGTARGVDVAWSSNVHVGEVVAEPEERMRLAVYAARSFPQWSASSDLPDRSLWPRAFGLLGAGSVRDRDVQAWRDTVRARPGAAVCRDCAEARC
jgi:hypothetical protein